VPVLSDVASKYFKNLNKFQRLKEEQIEFEQRQASVSSKKIKHSKK
jgi:hypothetical protein